jgi:hypothetical protein
MRRMRILGWQVQPVIMIDDGENLEQAQVQPQFIAAKQWDQFKNGGDEAALAQLRAETEDAPQAPGAA